MISNNPENLKSVIVNESVHINDDENLKKDGNDLNLLSDIKKRIEKIW